MQRYSRILRRWGSNGVTSTSTTRTQPSAGSRSAGSTSAAARHQNLAMPCLSFYAPPLGEHNQVHQRHQWRPVRPREVQTVQDGHRYSLSAADLISCLLKSGQTGCSPVRGSGMIRPYRSFGDQSQSLLRQSPTTHDKDAFLPGCPELAFRSRA